MTVTYPNLGNSGRLGNQLWQIASTLGIANRLGTDASFPAWDYQEFFSVPGSLFLGKEGTPASELVPHLGPQAAPYLQDFSLIRDVQHLLQVWFQPSNLAWKTLHAPRYDDFWALEPPVMALHVRRGDNANEGPEKADYHPLRPISYYLDALQLRDYQSVAVFSDDIPWCRETFGDSFHYVEGIPRPKEHLPEYRTAPVLDWIDLQLMSCCDYHILSNSTYSWWAAFLSQDDSPIYPTPWLGRKLRPVVDASLMFPSTWTELPHG